METITQRDDLQVLAQSLQKCLQQSLPQEVSWRVFCAWKQEVLMILTQHPGAQVADPTQMFQVLEQGVRSHAPQYSTVRFYLRVAGQKQPYAMHGFSLVRTDAASPSLVPESAPGSTSTSSPSDPAQSSEPKTAGETVAIVHLPRQNLEDAALELDEFPEAEVQTTRWVSLPIVAAGILISLLTFCGSFYVVSRPCVAGACPLLQKEQRSQQEIAQKLSTVKTIQDLEAIQRQLRTLIQELQAIPFWSQHYRQAQTLIQTYKTQAQGVNQVAAGLNQASTAAQKSQSPPHPLSTWIEIQTLWEQAIAQLEAIPISNPAAPLAQSKLREYRNNLQVIQQRIVLEQQADERLATAKARGQVAETRHGIAKDLDGWTQAHKNWQDAVQLLRQIPQGTRAYAESQQLLVTYASQQAAARDRQMQEQISTNTYKQAIALAEQAQRLENQQQWMDAAAAWRRALTYAEQIPSGTSYSGEVEFLVSTYTGALQQAEASVKAMGQRQGTQNDLERVCGGSPRVCTFTLSSSRITVQLTPDYLQSIRETAIAAETVGDTTTQATVRAHLQTLQTALEAIGYNAQIPIDLYDAQGALLDSYAGVMPHPFVPQNP